MNNFYFQSCNNTDPRHSPTAGGALLVLLDLLLMKNGIDRLQD